MSTSINLAVGLTDRLWKQPQHWLWLWQGLV